MSAEGGAGDDGDAAETGERDDARRDPRESAEHLPNAPGDRRGAGATALRTRVQSWYVCL